MSLFHCSPLSLLVLFVVVSNNQILLTKSQPTPAIYCDLPYDCAAQFDYDNRGGILCRGYSSCINSIYTSIEYYISCSGCFSCQNMGPIAQSTTELSAGQLLQTYISGFASGLGLFINDPWEFIDCEGELSCSLSNLISSYIFLAGGSRSLVYSTITVDAIDSTYATQAHIYGSFAFFNGILNITNTNKNSMEIYMQGLYSGYKSKIYCNQGNNCVINCDGTACVGMKVIYLPGSTGNVDCDDNNLNYCPEVIGDGCKSSIKTTVKYIDSDILCINKLTKIEGDLYDYYQLLPLDIEQYSMIFDIDTIDYLRDDDTCSILCDAFEECQDNTISIMDDSLCCTGESSCLGSSITLTENTDSNSLFCDGEMSCEFSTITLSNPKGIIWVRGKDGLSSSTVSYTNYDINKNKDIDTKIICSAETACEGSTINDIRSVVCDSREACGETKFYNVENIYGIGYGSLINSKIYYNSKSSVWNGNKLNIYSLSSPFFNKDKDLVYVECDDKTDCTIYCHDLGCDEDRFDITQCQQCEFKNDFAKDKCGSGKRPRPEVTFSPTEEPTEEPEYDRNRPKYDDRDRE